MRAFTKLGLVARTRLWIAVWLALALTTAVLSYSALQRLQGALDALVRVEFDELMNSVRLLQQTEALIGQSLLLTQVTRQEDRRRLRVEIQDREDWIRKIIQQKQQRGQLDASLVARVQVAQDRLSRGVTEMDTLVRQRLLQASQDTPLMSASLLALSAQMRGVAAQNQAVGDELSVLMGYFSAELRNQLRNRVDQLRDEVAQQQRLMVSLTVGMVLLGLVLGLYLQRRVVGRIVQLQHAVRHDDVQASELPTQGEDEIAHLAQTMQRYVQRIQANERQLQRVNQNLVYLSEHDPLTRLANRRHFDQAVRRLLALVPGPLALVVADIDHFKRVNDEHGHAVGDQALVHLAGLLTAAMRDQDALARFGGEEFVLAMPVPDQTVALEVCDRLRANVAQQPLLLASNQPMTLTISLGLALIDGLPQRLDEAQADALVVHALQLADAALYQAKDSGRNRVCVAPTSVDARRPTPTPTQDAP